VRTRRTLPGSPVPALMHIDMRWAKRADSRHCVAAHYGRGSGTLRFTPSGAGGVLKK
jgi:hypothetical protein